MERVHLINRTQDGALLLELFTRDGLGTLISSTPYEELRTATLNDIAGIIDLITPLEQQGKLIKRSRETLEIEIDDYIVIERDGLVIGCATLHTFSDSRTGEIASFAVHHDYQKADRGDRLLKYILTKARQNNLHKLFVLSTQTMHWFIERGFQNIEIETLPESLNNKYNHQRNSKVLCLDIQ